MGEVLLGCLGWNYPDTADKGGWTGIKSLSHLFINLVAIGTGLTIFKDLNEIQKFNLVKSVAFDCVIIGLHYEPKKVIEPYRQSL
jgi:hypothetical protein